MITRPWVAASRCVLAACGDPLAPTAATVEIGEDGGVVEIGGARLEVPAGALASPVAISVERVDDVPVG